MLQHSTNLIKIGIVGQGSATQLFIFQFLRFRLEIRPSQEGIVSSFQEIRFEILNPFFKNPQMILLHLRDGLNACQ